MVFVEVKYVFVVFLVMRRILRSMDLLCDEDSLSGRVSCDEVDSVLNGFLMRRI